MDLRRLTTFVVLALLPVVICGQSMDRRMLESVRDRAGTPDMTRPDVVPFVEGKAFWNDALVEAFWREALVWKLPYEIRAGRNREAPFETFVLVASNRERFLAAFVCLDSVPSRIRATRTDRDRWDRGDNDAVGLYLDTYGDKRNAYVVMANARGVQYDAHRLDRGGQGTHDDSSFDFLWYAESRIYDDGYIVAMEFSFRHLRQSKGENGRVFWNIMPFRIAPREFQYEMSAFPWDYDANCFLCQFPSIALQDPDHSFRPLQVIPYVSAVQDEPQSPWDFSPRAGLDIKYQHPEWALDATIYPDFSQVETDAFVMTTNIRFLPRLDEKRPFFMERADLFRFPISQIIYTRTLLDPDGGVRWTGKKDAHNWAVIALRDRATWLLFPGLESAGAEVLENQPSWNTIFRYRYDMSAAAVMGVFVTSREYDGGHNRLFSADAQFSLSSRHTLVGHVLGSSTRYPEEIAQKYGRDGETLVGYGYLLRFNRTGRTWSYNVETREYSDNLVTGMGFLQRVGIRLGNARTSWTFWPESALVRTIIVSGSFNGTWDSNSAEVMNISATVGASISGTRQSLLHVSIKQERERFGGRPFDLTSGAFSFSALVFPWYRPGINIGRGRAVDYRLCERMGETTLGWSQVFFLFDRRLLMSQDSRFLRLFQSVTAQKAWIHSLSAEFQATDRLAFRNILQWRDFRWEDLRYGDLVPKISERLENQILVRYRINYASAVYLGGFGSLHRTDGVPSRSWQAFFKVSFLL